MNITVMLPAGRLPLNIMDKAQQLAEKYQLEPLKNKEDKRVEQ